MNADQIIGERVLVQLHRRRLKKNALAEVLKVSSVSVGRKINGESTFSVDELLALARFFDVPVMDLLPDASYEPTLTGHGRKNRTRAVPAAAGGGAMFVSELEVGAPSGTRTPNPLINGPRHRQEPARVIQFPDHRRVRDAARRAS